MADGEISLIEALDSSGDFIGALDEFASIAATIARARAEIAALAPGEIRDGRLRPAGHELSAVTRDTEAATHAIMNAAETIAALSADGRVAGEVGKIFEACAFQDITGQRVAKVVEALAQIERQVARFARAMGIEETAPVARQARGPGLNGPHTDQDRVDTLMSASPAELALLLV